MLSHLALASTTRHGHSSQNARYIQIVKEHAAGFSAVRVSDLCVRNCHSELVGLGGLEPPASPLSGVRSNHLSYRPKSEPGKRWWSQSGSNRRPPACKAGALPAELWPRWSGRSECRSLVRTPDRQCAVFLSLKEVIQPHLPIRLPCYDFTPVIGHTVASALPKVKLPASGATNAHGVTGGVYKARERIHRSNADLRLLAIPTSWSRVADSNPD